MAEIASKNSSKSIDPLSSASNVSKAYLDVSVGRRESDNKSVVLAVVVSLALRIELTVHLDELLLV